MDLKALIERIETATGPDRELDSAIKLAAAAHLFATGATKDEAVSALGGDLYDDPLPYTASFDAAVALCERALPGWWLESMSDQVSASPGEKPVFIGAAVELSSATRTAQGIAATRSLALVLAILNAINGEQGKSKRKNTTRQGESKP